MKVLFKYSRIIERKAYVKGEYELPDALADNWYFKALVKDGDVVIIPNAEPAPPVIQEPPVYVAPVAVEKPVQNPPQSQKSKNRGR